VDYLALVDPVDFTELTGSSASSTTAVSTGEGTDGEGTDGEGTDAAPKTTEAVLAVAARVGTTRLIDNTPLSISSLSVSSPLGALR
jgi:pantoate--beta-alanine ligase